MNRQDGARDRTRIFISHRHEDAATARVIKNTLDDWQTPWEGDNQAHYWARSPLSLVGNVTTPTMLLTGELDLRTPMAETEQFYQALKLRKIDTQMVRMQGAYHGIVARPSNLIAKITYIARWFERYRTDGPAVSD